MMLSTRFYGLCGYRLRRVPGVLLAVLLVASVCAAQQLAEYVVGPNDVLSITVVDQPNLTGKFVVRADGTFTMPLLDRVKAGGLAVQAVEDDIRARLDKGYVKNPQVAVSVDVFRSQQIFVLGEVKQPGNLQFTGSMTVIEALARTGSTTDRAGIEALIVRPAGGVPPREPAPLDAAAIDRAHDSKDSEVIRVNIENLQSGQLSQNVALRSGDTVFVPRAKTVFVSGMVRTAGEYVIRKGMTVRQVLALAGGVTERGSEGRIQIIRQVDGNETTISVTLQDLVRAGDTVLVRERFF
jgi:polysaccharide export outer membrane protein